jgi:hypothetical protein
MPQKKKFLSAMRQSVGKSYTQKQGFANLVIKNCLPTMMI